MPTYEYHCDSCEKNFDVVQSFHDDALTSCPTCGSPVRKVFGNVGIVFKGSGFYKTDSRYGRRHEDRRPPTVPSSESSGSDSSGSDGDHPAQPRSSGDAPSKAASTETTTKAPAPSAPEKAAKSSAKDGTS